MRVAALTDDFRTVLAQLRADWDQSRIEGVRYLSGGYANDNYAFEYDHARYVLRIVRAGVPGPIPRSVERELLLGPLSGLTAPIVSISLPQGHLLSQFVDGDLLVHRGGGVAELAEYLAALHGRLTPFGWPHPIDHLIATWFEAAARAGYPVDSRWRRALAALPASSILMACHNDLNPWNVIARGSAPADWCTLDWEWCGDHDPCFDAVALGRGLMISIDAEDEVIDRHAQACTLERPSQDARRATRIRFHLREMAWALATMALKGERAELWAQVRNGEAALDALIG